MHRSRNLWILVLASVCLVGLLTWESPRSVVSALSHPGYSDSPVSTVQHFWNFLDNRQVDLIRETTTEGLQVEESSELRLWVANLEKNPLLSLQKVEFLDTNNPQAMLVRVSWVSPPHDVQTYKYSFDVRSVETGWKIYNFKRLP